MIKVVEFKKRNFWSSTIDLDELNNKIASYEDAGWTIEQITPLVSFLGGVNSFILILKQEKEFRR